MQCYHVFSFHARGFLNLLSNKLTSTPSRQPIASPPLLQTEMHCPDGHIGMRAYEDDSHGRHRVARFHNCGAPESIRVFQ